MNESKNIRLCKGKTSRGKACRNKISGKSDVDYCYAHNSSNIISEISSPKEDILMYKAPSSYINTQFHLPEVCIYNWWKNEKFWMCNKYLYRFSTLQYLIKGRLGDGIPCVNVSFNVLPSDSGYCNILKNIKLYIVICRDVKEYILCTMKQIRKFLHGMEIRWNKVEIHPYESPKSLICYRVSGYNFAVLGYKDQLSNNKYICDPSLLKNGKYTNKELVQIAKSVGMDIRNEKKKDLEKRIYNLL